MNSMMQRLIRTGVSVGAGYLGSKAVASIWRAATGEEAPTTDDDSVKLVKIVAFTVISAGVSTLVEVGSQRLVSKAISDTGNKTAQQLGKAEV